jgi:hypothetical protein
MFHQNSKGHSMMPQDHASGPEPPSKPSRTEEARRIVEEYADDLRKILKKTSQALQLTSSWPLSF